MKRSKGKKEKRNVAEVFRPPSIKLRKAEVFRYKGEIQFGG